MFGMLHLGILGVCGALSLATTALWVWALVDCIQHEPAEGNDRVVWVIVIACLGVLGALVYLGIRRGQRIAQHGH